MFLSPAFAGLRIVRAKIWGSRPQALCLRLFRRLKFMTISISLPRTVLVLCVFSLCVNAQTTTAPPPVVTATPEVAAAAKPTPVASPNTGKPTTAQQSAAGATAKGSFVLPPEKSQPIVIPKFDKPPVIDGKLDDEIWQKAVVLKDF